MDLVQHLWLDEVGHGRQSSPFDSLYIFGKTSGVACHHRPWTVYTVKRRRTWHINIALGLHTQLDEDGSANSIIDLGHYTRSDNAKLDMPTSPLERTRSNDIDVECHHPLWTIQIVRRHRTWHAGMALGQKTQLDDIRQCMPSSPLGKRCDQTTSGVACHHLSCVAHTARQCWARHPIIVMESIQSQIISS